jgi:hypothetical protein
MLALKVPISKKKLANPMAYTVTLHNSSRTAWLISIEKP